MYVLTEDHCMMIMFKLKIIKKMKLKVVEIRVAYNNTFYEKYSKI